MLQVKFFFLLMLSKAFLFFKPDNKVQVSDLNQAKLKGNYIKECVVKEKCRECTFEELKSMIECQATGYKVRKLCSFYDNTNLIEENIISDPCSDNIKINSVYYFLIVCVFIAVISWFVRKSHKNFLLQQLFEKLTIFKEH